METEQKRNGIKKRKKAIQRRRRKRAKKILTIMSVFLVIIAAALTVAGMTINKKVQETNQKKAAKELQIKREKAKVEVAISMVGDVLMHNLH